MSGDNFFSNLDLKFYSEESTETIMIIYWERKFHELDEFIENISEAA